LPGEAGEDALAGGAAQASGERGVGRNLLEAIVQLGDGARRDHEAGDAVLDDFGKTADATGNDGRAAGHSLQDGKAEQLRDANVAAVAGAID